MTNYYSGTKEKPHHISVGAILRNDKNEIACHYYEKKIRKYPENFYTLMHESVEMGETLEQTLHRGLQEEFGATAEIKEYVGSLVITYDVEGQMIEKTVIYFLCDFISFSERNMEDPENQSEIRWLPIDELIGIMKEQGRKFNTSGDESKILEDVKRYFI